MFKRLKEYEEHRNKVKFWVDEAIWGHRFYNDQTPWLTLLEFFSVFRSRNLEGKALEEEFNHTMHEKFSYAIPKLIPPRELIFNNPSLYYIANQNKSNEDKWAKWFSTFNSNFDYSDLKKRFKTFDDFYQLVNFYQMTSVEPHRKRRWTSRFLFPYGPDCIYADFNENSNERGADRRFFARSGELLYLMLNRSGSGSEIATLIREKLLRSDSVWNRAIKSLLPNNYDLDSVNSSGEKVSTHIGYLPFIEREEYVSLAHTWLSLLNLKLSGEVLFDPLMRLSTLHLLLYILKRSNEELGDSRSPKFVLEIASPTKTSLLELSKENLSANRMLSIHAIKAYIEQFKNKEEWRSIYKFPSPTIAAKEYLKKEFKWKGNEGIILKGPDDVFEEFLSLVEQRHRQHFAKIHMEWTRQIGLVKAKRGVGTWYSPSDSLLKALVLCVVKRKREEFNHFLSDLYDKFNIVIGAREAEKAFGSLPADQNVFTQNSQRLEQRLRTLGLLYRLSDDCAYVLNPFRSDK